MFLYKFDLTGCESHISVTHTFFDLSEASPRRNRDVISMGETENLICLHFLSL